MTADDILNILTENFCSECVAEQVEVHCEGCIVNDAIEVAILHKRIRREKKHANTNTQIRIG